MSCFCPVERVLPRSRTGSLKPPGSVRIKSATFTSSAECSTGSSSIQSEPRRILFDRSGEQEGVLQHHAEAAAQLGQVHVADIDAVDGMAPFCTS